MDDLKHSLPDGYTLSVANTEGVFFLNLIIFIYNKDTHNINEYNL